MTLITGCMMAENVAVPNDAELVVLLAASINPSGWCHFWTAKSDAWVWSHERSFILQWIESGQRGDGSILMRGISSWADMHRMLSGSLVCDPDLAPFYARFGWERGPDYNGEATMTWKGKWADADVS